MGKIELNLKGRIGESKEVFDKVIRYSMSRFSGARLTVKDTALLKRRAGIKAARSLVTMFKQSNLCPVIDRVSFSRIIITY